MRKLFHWISVLMLQYGKEEISQKAAALAFFTALSLAPLLIIAVSVAGFFFGEGAARAEIINQARDVVGVEGAEIVTQILENSSEPGSGRIALLIGLSTLLFGASTVFVQLRQILDSIWGITTAPQQAFTSLIRSRLLALLTVLGAGFALILLMVVALVLSSLETLLPSALLPSPVLRWWLEHVATLLLYTLVFAFMFKVIPRAKVPWRDVWLGALATALLFMLGTTLMRYFLSGSGMVSIYGAAATLLVGLSWLFYSAHILLIGAQITQLSSMVRGASIAPNSNTISLSKAQHQAEQRIAHHLNQE